MHIKKGIEHSSYFKFNDYKSINDTYVCVLNISQGNLGKGYLFISR